jgi:hypothetical protein
MLSMLSMLSMLGHAQARNISAENRWPISCTGEVLDQAKAGLVEFLRWSRLGDRRNPRFGGLHSNFVCSLSVSVR